MDDGESYKNLLTNRSVTNTFMGKMFNNAFLLVLLCATVNSQSNSDLYNPQYMNEFYNKQGEQGDSSRQTRIPSPGDSDYRTYVYNNRRYGFDPTRYNPYNPNINQPGGFPYNPIPYNPLNPNPLDDQYKYNVVSIFVIVFSISVS